MDEPIKVCHILSTFAPLVGGIQKSTERLCVTLREQGVYAVVLTRRLPGLSSSDECNGVPVVRAGHPSRSKLGAATFVIHSLWLLGTRYRATRLLHVQSIDAPLLIGLLCKVLLGRRVVATIHGEMMIVEQKRSRLGRLRVRLMSRLVDCFTALSPQMERQLREEKVPPSAIRFIPNGIDQDVFRPATEAEKQAARRRLDLPDSAVIVLYVGRLIELKQVDVLLKAWSQRSACGDDLLVIVGDGPEMNGLQRLAQSLGIDARFFGAQTDVASFLRASDVFVLPSRMEGLSVALLEAMSSGLAVIVSDLPGNLAVVRNDVNGMVVPAADRQALVRALNEMLSSGSRRNRLGAVASRTIGEMFSLTRVAAEHKGMYAELLRRSATAPKLTSAALNAPSTDK